MRTLCAAQSQSALIQSTYEETIMKCSVKILKALVAILPKDYRDFLNHIYFDADAAALVVIEGHMCVAVSFKDQPVNFKDLKLKSVPVKSIKMACAGGDKIIDLEPLASDFKLKDALLRELPKMFSFEEREVTSFTLDAKILSDLSKCLAVVTSNLSDKNKHFHKVTYCYDEARRCKALKFSSRHEHMCVDAVLALVGD